MCKFGSGFIGGGGARRALPMGVIVEIGCALDPKTRINLMLANKLFMEAFSKDERANFRKEFASESLANTWESLLEYASKKNYRMIFEFEPESHNGYLLGIFCIVILPGKVRFNVGFNFSKQEVLERVLPKAIFEVDHTFEDDDEYLEIKVSAIDRLDKNEASSKTIVKAIRMVTSGMLMMPPRAYTMNPSWLTRLQMYFMGDRFDRYSLQPVFEKMAIYHVSASAPTKSTEYSEYSEYLIPKGS